MTYLDDFKARWEANETRLNANRQRFMPSAAEHTECDYRRYQLCRELVVRLADRKPTDLCDWPRIAELVEASRLVTQSLMPVQLGHANLERSRPCAESA